MSIWIHSNNTTARFQLKWFTFCVAQKQLPKTHPEAVWTQTPADPKESCLPTKQPEKAMQKMTSSTDKDTSKQQCPRRQTKREILLHLDKSQLITQMSFRGNHCNEILHASRDANATIRSHYKDFIHQVGRNVFPLIIASDHENDGYSGVGWLSLCIEMMAVLKPVALVWVGIMSCTRLVAIS